MSVTDYGLRYSGGSTCFLLVHGLGGTPQELKFVAQGLSGAGYAVECCQLAAHCGSIEDLRTSAWQDWYATVEHAFDRLRGEYEVVIAGGLSMGAILTLHLAHERPGGVDGLALFAPTLWLDGWAMPWYSALLRYIRPTQLPVELELREREPFGLKDERVRAFIVKSMVDGDASQAGLLSTPLRAFAQFNGLVSVVTRELPAIATPTLILHPREDDIASLGNAHYLQRNLGGRADVVVLDDSYHIVTLDRQRHMVVDRSADFAREVEAARGAAAERWRTDRRRTRQ